MYWHGIALESDGPLEPNSGYESLTKMRLEDEVQGQYIAEALRLFKVSTMAANIVDTSVAIGKAGSSANGKNV
jgi:DNA replicative helicase MCM subunit Mcm2 (Cdc46/Mcm family)